MRKGTSGTHAAVASSSGLGVSVLGGSHPPHLEGWMGGEAWDGKCGGGRGTPPQRDRLGPSTQREEESAGSGLPSGLSSPVPRAYPRVSFRTLPKVLRHRPSRCGNARCRSLGGKRLDKRGEALSRCFSSTGQPVDSISG